MGSNAAISFRRAALRNCAWDCAGSVAKSPKTWVALVGGVALGALAGVALFVGPKAPRLKALKGVPTYGRVLVTVGAVALGGAVGFGLAFAGKKVRGRFSGKLRWSSFKWLKRRPPHEVRPEARVYALAMSLAAAPPPG